jgi:hypothetical protein
VKRRDDQVEGKVASEGEGPRTEGPHVVPEVEMLGAVLMRMLLSTWNESEATDRILREAVSGRWLWKAGDERESEESLITHQWHAICHLGPIHLHHQ